MKLVYLVRHGLTDGNKIRQFQHPDIELSDEGLRQARSVAERFRTIPIDCIFSSDMTRARQTAEAIARETGKQVIETDLLREIRRPTSMIGKSRLEPEHQAVEDELREHFSDPAWRHSDEENYFDLKERAQNALKFILGRDEENVAVVSHGLIIKMIVALAIISDELTPAVFEKFDRGLATFNTGITKLKYDERGWYLIAWNDTAHFEEIQNGTSAHLDGNPAR